MPIRDPPANLRFQDRATCDRCASRPPIRNRLHPRRLDEEVGRPHAHPDQHFVLRHVDRTSLDQDGIRRNIITNQQPLAARDSVVLHLHHEPIHDLQGHFPVGQGLRKAELPELVQAGLLYRLEFP